MFGLIGDAGTKFPEKQSPETHSRYAIEFVFYLYKEFRKLNFLLNNFNYDRKL